MVLVAAGAVIGVAQHLQGNLAFEREIYPHAAIGDLLWSAVRGVAPLAAPGGLILGAVAASATWRHPAATTPAG